MVKTTAAIPDPITKRLGDAGLIAVLIIDDVNDAVPVAQALLDGGVTAIELTMRTPAALDSVRRIVAEVPAMTVGVGTVLTPRQVAQVFDAGAAFAVAPGMNPATVAAARQVGLPFAPGVCTPTDIELAVEAGCRLLKFFPCEPSGGLKYLSSIAAPFAHLGVRFIPLGGIDATNAEPYLVDPLIHAIGGSWLASRSAITDHDWQGITARASAATALVQRVRDEQAARTSDG